MKLAKTLVAVLVPVTIIVGGLEIATRFVPEVVPLEILQRFHADVRHAIAEARKLPNRAQVMIVERDDGGPLLRRYRPNTTTNTTIVKDMGDPGATPEMVTDGLGFCNPGAQTYEAKDIDIIVIGDSFTWCSTVEAAQAWPARLAELSGRSLYNLGIPGIGLHEYLVLLRTFGLRKSPEIVIMNVYEGNDLRDALRFHRHRENTSRSTNPAACKVRLCEWLGSWSYAFNLARGAWIQLLRPLLDFGLKSQIEQAAVKDKPNFRYWVERDGLKVPFNESNGDRDEIIHAMLLEQGAISLSLFDDALLTFIELSEEHGFVPVVLYSPSAHTAYRKGIRFEDESIARTLSTYSDRLRAYFRTKSEEYNYHFLDLTEFLQRHSEEITHRDLEQFVYFPNSVHYSPAGHNVVAEEAWRFLEDLTAALESR
jgi:hypothetical protein